MSRNLSKICLILTLLIPNSLQSLTCYTCSTILGNQYPCENITSATDVMYNTCAHPNAVCAKYLIDYGDSLMVHRNCQYKFVCRDLAVQFNAYLVDCQECDDRNYCNSANLMNYEKISFFILVLVAFIRNLF